jgi:hypothetical protein
MAKPTDKNTKAEILTAYNQLYEEKRSMESQIKTLQKHQNEPTDSTAKTPSNKQNTTVSNYTINNKIDQVIENLNRLQVGFGAAVGELSEKLSNEVIKLGEIRSGVDHEVEQLKTLYNLEVSEETLGELISQYEVNSKQFAEELKAEQTACQEEISEQLKEWKKEQEQHQLEIKERNETHQKSHQRSTQEYHYNLQLERQLDQETYAKEQRSLEQELADIKSAKLKEWEQRESVLAEREKHYHEVKAKVEAFPQEKETAIKKAKEEGKGIATYQAKIKADLFAKEIEGQKRFYDGRIQSLEDNILTQEQRIQSLSQQLQAALKQGQDLALKAIEGSANANSYQTLKEITLEQAKAQSKMK